MICVNELTAQKCNKKEILEPLAVLLAPFAAHFSEELWQHLGNSSSISKVSFPIHEPKFLVESSKNYPVSFNGEELILKEERTQQQLQGRIPKKVIIVPGKIINIVG